ncbi:Uncharacterized protein YggN [Salmonella bongori]|nr:Uncharacterized protein YggN [Salmonella bongori]
MRCRGLDDGARSRVEKSRVALDKIIAKEVGESSNMRSRLTKLDAQLKAPNEPYYRTSYRRPDVPL